MLSSVFVRTRRLTVGAFLTISVVVASSEAMALQDEATQKLLNEFNKDALRDLDRGKPAQQLAAARILGPAYAERVLPVLTRFLADPAPANRQSAADALWNLASRKPAAIVSAQPALRKALDDADPAVAMNAAGALTAMAIPDEETAPARRRVLEQGGGSTYVRFLAARGLIGIDPGAPLVPALIAFLFDPGTAESLQNRDIAVQALKALVQIQDRALIPLLQARLGTEQPATQHLLRAMHEFEPRPDGWTETLLAHTRLRNRDTVSTAWSLVSSQKDAASVKAWAPLAVERLANPETRASALSALSTGAGRTTIGLEALAQLSVNASATAEHRERALQILGKAASEAGANIDRQVAAAARAVWSGVCGPILSSEPFGKRFEACFDEVPYIYQDNAELAPVLTVWLSSNRDVEAKRGLLARIGRTGSKGYASTDVVKRELTHPDPRVVKSAEAALDLIRPAWRESAARQERTPPSSSPAPAKTAGAGPGADGPALFEAVREGNIAVVKKLVNAANVDRPVNFPQMTGGTPIPLAVAINHCHIESLKDSLPTVVEYLMSLGANPDVVTQGENLLDRAKKACPPQVMQLLSPRK